MLLSSSSTSTRSAVLLGMAVGSAATAIVMHLTYQRRQNQRDYQDSIRKGNTITNDNSERGLSGNDGAKPSTSFLTDLIEQMWSNLKVAGANKIKAKVEPYFQDLPGPLNKLQFTKIDLGDVPIRMENIVVHERTETDNSGGSSGSHIQMDMTVIWDGNCDIQLQIAEGSGSLASGYGFGVQEIKLIGRMTFVFKPLKDELPIISGIQYSFINPPSIDLKFTGLANVADWSTLGVDQAVRQSLNESMLCMVLPNRSLYKMMSNNNYVESCHLPLGVGRITAISGRGFEIEKIFIGQDDIPDVYLNVTLGTSDVWRTRTIQDDCNPNWGEAEDHADQYGDFGEFLIDDREQIITIHAWDEDRGMLDPDDDLGIAKVSVGELLLARGRIMELPLLFNTKDKNYGKETGAFITIRLDICKWTTTLSSLKQARSTRNLMQLSIEEEKNSSTNQTKNDLQLAQFDNTKEFRVGGLLFITISRAVDIPIPRDQAATFCKVTYGSNVFETSVITNYPGYCDGQNPIYDAAFRVALTPNRMQNTMGRGPSASVVKIELFQNNESIADDDNKTNGSTAATTLLGSTAVDFSDLSRAPDNTITEQRFLGVDGKSGPAIEFQMSLHGVEPPPLLDMDTTRHMAVPPGIPTMTPAKGSDQSGTKKTPNVGFSEPIGTVRVTIVKARGLQIQEELFNIDIPDVYCTVSLRAGGQTNESSIDSRLSSSKKRTSVTTPIWRTQTIHNSCLPTWDETKEFPLYEQSQILSIEMWDLNEREYDPDIFVGSANVTIGKLLLSGGSMDVPVKSDGCDGSRGDSVILTLKCEML